MSSTNDSLGGFQNCSGFDLDAWIAEDCSFTSSHRSNGLHNSQGFSIQSSGANHVQSSLAGGSHVTQREGDWLCEHCSSLNFAKRTRCNKCGAPKSRRANENAATFNDLSTFGGPVGLYKKAVEMSTGRDEINAMYVTRQSPHQLKHLVQDELVAITTFRIHMIGNSISLMRNPSTNSGDAKKKKNTSNKYAGSVKMDSSGYTSCSVSSTSFLDGQNAPLKLFFPPPPLCYLKGRTASMSSVSSRSSQYEDSPVAHNNDDDVSVDE